VIEPGPVDTSDIWDSSHATHDPIYNETPQFRSGRVSDGKSSPLWSDDVFEALVPDINAFRRLKYARHRHVTQSPERHAIEGP